MSDRFGVRAGLLDFAAACALAGLGCGTRATETPAAVAPGWRMRIGRLSGPEAGGVEPGTDVNADGVPDVTVWDWSVGAHCCFTTIVLSLGARVDSLATIATGNTGGRFVNLDDDPALEFETAEDGFAYWPASYAESASPRVVLDWTPEGLAASAALTIRPVARDNLDRLLIEFGPILGRSDYWRVLERGLTERD